MKTDRSVKVGETINQATQSLVSSLSTSYGPKGLDKMLIKDGKTIITNDGATILSYFKNHPIFKTLGSVSNAQDVNCGDGTTSVVILAGCLFGYLHQVRNMGVHPSKIVEALEMAKKMAVKYIDEIKIKIDPSEFISVARTTLSSKISAKSNQMAQIAVEALKNCTKEDLHIIKKIGGNIDDIELFNSMIIDRDIDIKDGRYKTLLLQFCISPPKTNLDSKILIDDYSLMEQFVREERDYIINIIKAIRRTGANLIIIQKSLLKESCCELAQHLLKKINIAFIDNVDRKEMDVLSKRLNITPVSDVEAMVEPVEVEVRKTRDMLELLNIGNSIVVTGCDQMIVDEAERSLNDALSVVKSLMNEPFIVPGGGSIETGISAILEEHTGPFSIITKEISKGFISMPHFLAQNAGMYSVEIVSQLRKNILTNKNLGISLRTGFVADMVNDDNIIQPAAVSKSMVILAIETVQMLIRIDDILPTVQ